MTRDRRRPGLVPTSDATTAAKLPRMSDEAICAAAFGVAATTCFLVTPLALRVAERTGFLDRPFGY